MTDRRQALTAEFNLRERTTKAVRDYAKMYADELRRAERGERDASDLDLEELRAGVERAQELVAAEARALARVEAERDALTAKRVSL